MTHEVSITELQNYINTHTVSLCSSFNCNKKSKEIKYIINGNYEVYLDGGLSLETINLNQAVEMYNNYSLQ